MCQYSRVRAGMPTPDEQAMAGALTCDESSRKCDLHRTWLQDSCWRSGSRAASVAKGRKALAACMCLDSLVSSTTSRRHSTIQPKTLGHDNQAGIALVRGKGRKGTATQSGSPSCAEPLFGGFCCCCCCSLSAQTKEGDFLMSRRSLRVAFLAQHHLATQLPSPPPLGGRKWDTASAKSNHPQKANPHHPPPPPAIVRGK